MVLVQLDLVCGFDGLNGVGVGGELQETITLGFAALRQRVVFVLNDFVRLKS